jgi:hypothetical protein
MRALLLVALAACSDHGARLHVAPKTVGSRSTFHRRIDGQLKAPDGTEHGMHSELSLVIVVDSLATNGRADRLRVTVDRHDDVFDGHAQPTLSGTYDVNSDGAASREDGKPLAQHEVAFFHDFRDLGQSAGSDHEFHTGETFRPSEQEALAYGLPPSKEPLAFLVQRASDAEIVLAGDYVPTESAPEVEAHGHLVVTLTPTSHTRVGDLTFRSHGQDAGAIHLTAELRQQR